MTDIVDVVAPVFHKYELAPPTVNIVEKPSQIAVDEATTETTGKEFTVTVTVSVFEQPIAFVPVTV